jgi:hypothetical protein
MAFEAAPADIGYIFLGMLTFHSRLVMTLIAIDISVRAIMAA